MGFDWKKAVGAAAPLLGAAVAGPYGAMAAKVITDALGLPCESTNEQIDKQIRSDPEAMVKLRKAEMEFKARLRELEIKEEELVYKDLDSARRREVDTGAEGSHTINRLAYMIFIIVVVVISGTGYLFAEGKLSGMESMQASVLTLILREAYGKMEQVCNYFFGSSHGSAQKNEMMIKSKS